MTDRTQFEAMLEALINEDQETAKEIFHNIVVGKSREIYEELLESDFSGDEEDDEEADDEESDEEDDDSVNPFGDDEESDEEDDDSENPFGDDEDDEEGEDDDRDTEDRLLDLEDALDELKAEFEELLAGEQNEPEHDDMFGGEEEPAFGDEEEDEFGADLGDDDQEVKEINVNHMHTFPKEENEFEAFMEYVNKVALPSHGDNGVNNRSTIDNMKNDMGGKVIGRSSEETKGGTNGGLLNPATKPQTAGNVNVPGSKTATKLKPVSKGHGAEKKGTGEKSVNDQSLFRGR